MATCKERDELTGIARRAISDMMRCTDKILTALEKGDTTELLPLDKHLEAAFGDKERAFGALRQHRKDHGC